MATRILLSTTGTLDPVVIDDLGARSFSHPTVNLDLCLEFSAEEIRDSEDTQTAIDNGHITLTDIDGNDITVVSDSAVAHIHLYGELVFDKDLTTPPGSPLIGDTYIVATGGSGDWTGHDKELAEWNGSFWQFTIPGSGALVWVGDEKENYVYDGSSWILKAGGGGIGYEAEILTYTDTVNKVIGPMAAPPETLTKVTLFVFTGAVQEYQVDYTVRQVTGGAAPGYYVCIDPTSTAPGGGSFLGGSNPSGPGIAVTLTSGDTVRTTYPT